MTPRLRVLTAELAALLLTSTALTPLFDGSQWLVHAAVVVLVAVLVAELARRSGVVRVLVPLVATAAVVLELVVTSARDTAPYGLVPSPEALRALGNLAVTGYQDSASYAAPAPETAGLLLLVSAGVGVVAVAVDTVAATLRRPALAGLPLLALYAVPAAISGTGAPWYAFVLGATGYLGLLYAESRDRVSRWGRVLGTGGRRARSSALAALGRRVGGTALAVAVVVPALLPGLDGHALHLGSGSGARNGSARIGSGDPLVNLSRDLGDRAQIDVLDFTIPAPRYGSTDPGAPYLRTAVFDTFDPRSSTWKHGQTNPDRTSRNGGMTLPWGDDPGVGRTVTIQTQDVFHSSFLPMPYGATHISGLHGTWVADDQSREVKGAGKRTAQGMTYSVDQTEPVPDAHALLDAKVGSASAVYLDTAGLQKSPLVRQALRQAVGNEKRPYAQALLLQNWFHSAGGFRYDLDAPVAEPGRNLIETFLVDRSGFCVHYASAMVMLARVLGIPARLAVGYLPGAQQVSQDQLEHFQVTTLQSHAWPELYFAGYGWLRFEPTPRSDGLTETPTYATAASPDQISPVDPSSSAASSSSGASTGASARPSASDRDVIAPTTGGGGFTTPTGGNAPWAALAGVTVLLLAFGAPALSRIRLRRARLGRGDARGLWDELCDSALDLGLPSPAPARTARQYAALLGRYAGLPGDGGSPLHVLVTAYERSAYARAGTSETDDDQLAAARTALVEVRDALHTCVRRRDRWRAGVLPASTWRGVRGRAAGLPSAVTRLAPSSEVRSRLARLGRAS